MLLDYVSLSRLCCQDIMNWFCAIRSARESLLRQKHPEWSNSEVRIYIMSQLSRNTKLQFSRFKIFTTKILRMFT